MEKSITEMTDEELKIHDLEKDVIRLEAELKREKAWGDTYEKIPKLYYSYKSVSDDDIKKKLAEIQIVKKEHKGVGTEFGYYPYDLTDALESPRGISLGFGGKTSDELVKGLKKYKTITYLVKSSSRFFLKNDIGEVFDQMELHDFYTSDIKAICLNEGYTQLPGTDGEHFLMTAILLVDENCTRECEPEEAK
jgi:hypothetical protein